MSSEVLVFALKTTLKEIQNACPGVTTNFIFRDEKIDAGSENTEEENAIQTVKAFKEISERAAPIGDVETITIRSAEGNVNIGSVDGVCSTMVMSKEADEKYVNTLTRILIPTVVKIVEEIQPASADIELVEIDPNDLNEDFGAEETLKEPEENKVEDSYDEEEVTATNNMDEATEEDEAKEDDKTLLPEPPVTQLIVEKLGGLLVPSDTVRVDQEVIEQWNELYGDKKITEVEVEALNGKTTRCKYRQIKKSKDAGKGIIKMPDKIQNSLETTSGELVTVKPIVE